MPTPDNRPEDGFSADDFFPERGTAIWPRARGAFRIRLAFVAFSIVSASLAQSPDTAADRAWQELSALATPPPRGSGTAKNRADSGVPGSQLKTRFHAAAAAARSFQDNYPDDERSAEARQIEARIVLLEAIGGDPAKVDHATALAARVRSDVRLPAKLRLETIALADIVRLHALAGNRSAFLAGHEQAARALIAEFPHEAGGYEVLLRCALNHPDDADVVRIASELESMPAPAAVRAAARTLRERHALVGQSLQEIAGRLLGASNPIAAAEGRGIVLYSWSSDSPVSMAAARNLVRLAPPTAKLIGISGDTDVAAARASASGAALPGEQILDAHGFDSPFAQALKLTRAGEAYIVSSDGQIRSVSARHGNLSAKFRAAGPAPAATSP